MSQKGFAPILIILLIAGALGGYLLYQVKSPKPETRTPTISPTAIPPSQKPSPTANSMKTPTKVTATTSTTPTPTTTPSPVTSPDPTIKPSPVQGVYKLNLTPTSDIQISTSSQGYIATILLADSNGDIIYDQSDFTFSISIDSPIAIVSLLDGYCDIDHIKSDSCPKHRLSIDYQGNSFTAGTAKISVKSTQKSTGKVVAEGAYSLTIK